MPECVNATGHELVRVVEIVGEDVKRCVGTHAHAMGEVRSIEIVKFGGKKEKTTIGYKVS